MVKPIYVPSILSYFIIKMVLFDVDLFPPCFDMESATCHYSYTILHIYLPARGQLELPARGQTNRAARSACSHGSCSIGTARYVTMHCKYSILNHPCYWCSRRSGYSLGSPSIPPTWSDCQKTVQFSVFSPVQSTLCTEFLSIYICFTHHVSRKCLLFWKILASELLHYSQSSIWVVKTSDKYATQEAMKLISENRTLPSLTHTAWTYLKWSECACWWWWQTCPRYSGCAWWWVWWRAARHPGCSPPAQWPSTRLQEGRQAGGQGGAWQETLVMDRVIYMALTTVFC